MQSCQTLSNVSPPLSSDSINLYTDASFKGLGGFFQGHWFSFPFTPFYDNNDNLDIAFLELLAVFVIVSTWCHLLKQKQIVIFTDNEAIVTIWTTDTSKDKRIMTVVRELFYVSTNYSINISFRHIPGKFNINTDLLSRLQVEVSKSICPNYKEEPSLVPSATQDDLHKILNNT